MTTAERCIAYQITHTVVYPNSRLLVHYRFTDSMHQNQCSLNTNNSTILSKIIQVMSKNLVRSANSKLLKWRHQTASSQHDLNGEGHFEPWGFNQKILGMWKGTHSHKSAEWLRILFLLQDSAYIAAVMETTATFLLSQCTRLTDRQNSSSCSALYAACSNVERLNLIMVFVVWFLWLRKLHVVQNVRGFEGQSFGII